jgi:hypothetical protein
MTWTNLQLAKHKTAPFCTQTSKNDFHVIIRIFETAKKPLYIFEKSLKQVKAMDHIYHLFKPELVLIEMLQRSRERE